MRYTEQCKTTFLPLTSNWLNIGTTPKDASKKRKSTDQSKPGNESGGATPKTASKKRKSRDKSKSGNEAGGVTGMSGEGEDDQSESHEMSTVAEEAGANGIAPSPNKDESQENNESMVKEVHELQTLISPGGTSANGNTSCTT